MVFTPTFGNRPDRILGRDDVIEAFISSLKKPVGHPNRSTLVLGQRGMGKTALLLEVAERAADAGFVVARVTANQDMLPEIIEYLQILGAPLLTRQNHRSKASV
ncbi:MAG: ATP-binding protein [Coriobacteriales bacterium]|jgi:predicted AAA+ superfamily ATPase|nr:ATP-binding protein [Coriobacteriales bacterium]